MKIFTKDNVYRISGLAGLLSLLAIAVWLEKKPTSDERNEHARPHDHSDPAQHGRISQRRELTPEDLKITHGKRKGDEKDGSIFYEAFSYGFSPDPLVVKTGETVNLRVKSRDVTHGMMIPEIDFNTEIPPGDGKDVEFKAPVKPGEYDIYCSVFCGSGHGDMRGTLLVLTARDGTEKLK